MLDAEHEQLMNLSDPVRYYHSYFTTTSPGDWDKEGFEKHYLAKPPPDFADRGHADKVGLIKSHFVHNLRLIYERQPPFEDATDGMQITAGELLEYHRNEKGKKKKRKREHFLANHKTSPEPEPEQPPTKQLNVNIGQVNVNAPTAGGNLNFANPLAGFPVMDMGFIADANANINDFPAFSPSPGRRALLEDLPASPNSHELAAFLNSRESSLPPTVVLSPADTTPSLAKVVAPSYTLSMPFDLHFNLIEDHRRLALVSGGTLEELMLDVYHTNKQDPLLCTYIDWGLLHLSDVTITEQLQSHTVKELLAMTKKTLHMDPEFEKIVERYCKISEIVQEAKSIQPLEAWYSKAILNFLDYPANILCNGDWWRHERFWSFLDNLFVLSSRVTRRRTTLQKTPSKREPSHCNIYEYYDRDSGLQLAYLEHQLNAAKPEHLDIFYLGRALLSSYRDWMPDSLTKELTVFAIICNGPKINIYRFAPVSDHFVVVTSHHTVISQETIPKVLEILYRVKLSMDHSLSIFDKHFSADDPF